MMEAQTTFARSQALSYYVLLCLCMFLLSCSRTIQAFSPIAVPTTTLKQSPGVSTRVAENRKVTASPSASRLVQPSSSALSVWWFGGTEEPIDDGADSCELVAVRIEKTSPNSRRIAGEITVPTSLEDVWSILTDYDRLSIHVPNLVESRRVQIGRNNVGEPGDGQYKCRLYQKGAQKIVGFEFGASVTMDMVESAMAPSAKKIGFRCVESQFFSEFDGEWKVVETVDENGQPMCTVSYSVDVRPRGPVPVAALEWRIREDVPTNLRAVKRAAMEVGYEGVMATRQRHRKVATVAKNLKRNAEAVRSYVGQAVAPSPQLTPASLPRADWGDDETMAAYL